MARHLLYTQTPTETGIQLLPTGHSNSQGQQNIFNLLGGAGEEGLGEGLEGLGGNGSGYGRLYQDVLRKTDITGKSKVLSW